MLSVPILCASAADDISVTLDGKEIAFDKAPQIMNGRVMVPMRKAFEAIDAKISWDGEASAATAVKEAQYAKFINGSGTMELGVCKDGKDDGEQVFYSNEPLDSAPVIIDGTMYVPMRALAETFHYNVEWNADKKTAEITTPTDADGWIYYSSWSDEGHMYKADTNGQHRQLLSMDDCYATRYSSFGYGNGYIFYSVRDAENRDNPNKVEGQLYRIKTDGTGKEKLTDNVAFLLSDYKKSYSCPTADENDDLFFVMNDKINGEVYYNNSKSYLYKVNAESGEVTKILDEPIRENFTYLYSDYIYFGYDSDELYKRYSVYRMDKNGENIINVTGDIAADRISFDIENDRIKFSSYYSGFRKEYSAELDGSDMQLTENDEYGRHSSNGLISEHYAGDGFAVGVKDYGSDDYFVVDEEGNILSVISAPEGFQLDYAVNAIGDTIYYAIYNMPDFPDFKTMYVTSLDELLGMENITVSSEKVDGKYEIKTRYTDDEYRELLKKADWTYEIHSVNKNGTDDKVILEGYSLSYYRLENKITISLIKDEMEGNHTYFLYDPETGNIEEYIPDERNVRSESLLNENVHYGITVKNDGTVEDYRGNNWW